MKTNRSALVLLCVFMSPFSLIGIYMLAAGVVCVYESEETQSCKTALERCGNGLSTGTTIVERIAFVRFIDGKRNVSMKELAERFAFIPKGIETHNYYGEEIRFVVLDHVKNETEDYYLYCIMTTTPSGRMVFYVPGNGRTENYAALEER